MNYFCALFMRYTGIRSGFLILVCLLNGLIF